jgi:hypothetical protein
MLIIALTFADLGFSFELFLVSAGADIKLKMGTT